MIQTDPYIVEFDRNEPIFQLDENSIILIGYLDRPAALGLTALIASCFVRALRKPHRNRIAAIVDSENPDVDADAARLFAMSHGVPDRYARFLPAQYAGDDPAIRIYDNFDSDSARGSNHTRLIKQDSIARPSRYTKSLASQSLPFAVSQKDATLKWLYMRLRTRVVVSGLGEEA